MKKLKKGLSLLLVFAMIFSFASTAFAANTEWKDYSADTAIANTDAYEAVQVMAGLGIIDGVSDNVLNPTGNFTRGQAAKIITYMLLGPEDASVLKADAKVFSDVETNEWFAPYVEFCKDAGIIDGYEDGTFHPYRTLTTDQWLKMLLTAIGFDGAKFGLTGKDWAINTAEVALRYDLITADEYALDFDREVAILYAYKALQFQFDGNDPLATSVFQLTSKVTYDIFAAPTAEVFSSKGEEIASIAITADATSDDAEYTVPAGAIVYIDGVKQTTTPKTVGGKSVEVSYYKTNAYSDASKGAVIVKNTYVAKLENDALLTALNKVNSDAKLNTVVTYNMGNKNVTAGKSSQNPADVAYANVKVLTATAGTITARNEKENWVNVGGNETKVYFNKNGKPDNKNEAKELNTNIKYNLYYDKFGNIAYVDTYVDAPAPKTLIFLIAAYAKTDKDYSDITEPKDVETTQAKYIDLTTGEIAVTEFASLDGLTVEALTYGNGTPDNYYAKGTINQFYYAVENEDGIALERYYTFDAAKVVKEDAHVVLSNVTDPDNDKYTDDQIYTVDSKTNLTVIDYTGALETKSISKVTGIANFETRTYNYTNTYATVVDYGVANVPSDVYVITPVAEPEATYVYGLYLGKDTDYAVEGQGYQFVLSDGTTATYYFDEKNPANAITNPSDGYNALVEGQVYKLTIQNGSFTDTLKLAAIEGEVIKTDVSYIAINKLESVYYYSNGYGLKVLDKDGKAVSITVKGDVDGKGVAATTGTTVRVYTDTDGIPGKVVFVTDATAGYVPTPAPSDES